MLVIALTLRSRPSPSIVADRAQPCSTDGTAAGSMRSPAGAPRWSRIAAAEDRDAAGDLDRGQRLVEQQRGQGHADERLEQHQDPGPGPADRPDAR